ncbi:MAG: ATP-binding cassette domain-containing protein [Oscillospiraceae bacterium]|nr:ATP-binding cassette domain-containing protein [Oscillospiraceae bacterium]
MVSLAVEHLTVTYPECSAPVLHDVSFTLNEGEFAVICGATGCGKTTLLHMLKRELTPLCTQTGTVYFRGTPLPELDARTAAGEIGFVMQHPEQQIVTDKVWHELAFGLENLGTPQEIMHRRIAEIASYFGMEDWLSRDPSTLSGGQKQILNLASVMIMQPRLLLLDEPTAQLDPIAAADFFTTLRRLNRDFSVTILLAEHRLEEVIPQADRLLILDSGTVTHSDAPERVLRQIAPDAPVMAGMPAAVRLYHAARAEGECPLSVNAARNRLMPQFARDTAELPPRPVPEKTEPAVRMKEVFFRYERHGRDVLSDLSMTVYCGELFCLVGGNGAGKSTVLSVLAGLHRAYTGKTEIFGKRIQDYKYRTLHQQCVTLLPQDVQTVFLKNTVAEELAEISKHYREELHDFPFPLEPLLPQHPYDLSGGQQQIAALAKVMLTHPRLLLLDEPTKGLDAVSKQQLADVLHGLQQNGVTVLLVTHDIEFAACHADRCGFLSRGTLISADQPERFFSENAFYTTAASRISRGFYRNAVTVAQVAELCRKNGRAKEAAL